MNATNKFTRPIMKKISRLFKCLAGLVLLMVQGCNQPQEAQDQNREVPGTDYAFSELFLPVPLKAKFIEEGYETWGGSMIRTGDGTCHLFYSRWPSEAGHRGWVSRSEVAHATSEHPLGPYEFRDVALPYRGENFWDGMMTHNPTIHCFGNQYFLYYTGTRGDTLLPDEEKYWNHRNNQRIGVAVASSPNGPWVRFDNPLIDVSTDPGASDALITTNPSVVKRPRGGFLMVYKAAAKDPSKENLAGPVVHRVAMAEHAEGPFTKQPGDIFTGGDEFFPAEDPFIWYQNDRYLAIVKDMNGTFTDHGRALVLFESVDGLNWQLCKKPLVSNLKLTWADGTNETFQRLERPQLWFENKVPSVICVAVMDVTGRSYHIQVPLNAHLPIR